MCEKLDLKSEGPHYFPWGSLDHVQTKTQNIISDDSLAITLMCNGSRLRSSKFEHQSSIFQTTCSKVLFQERLRSRAE